jgi:hypothetical protein
VKEKRKDIDSVEIKDAKVEIPHLLSESLRFLIISFVITMVTFGIFMYGRTMKDEQLAGFLGLAPVTLIFITFWVWFFLKFFRERGKKEEK